MNLSLLSEEQRREVAGLLEAFAGFGKAARPGEVLATRLAPAAAPALARAWASPETASRGEFRTIVRIVDFMAAARPDNDGVPWRAETLELASRLRKIYAAEFGGNAYDPEAGAP